MPVPAHTGWPRGTGGAAYPRGWRFTDSMHGCMSTSGKSKIESRDDGLNLVTVFQSCIALILIYLHETVAGG